MRSALLVLLTLSGVMTWKVCTYIDTSVTIATATGSGAATTEVSVDNVKGMMRYIEIEWLHGWNGDLSFYLKGPPTDANYVPLWSAFPSPGSSTANGHVRLQDYDEPWLVKSEGRAHLPRTFHAPSANPPRTALALPSLSIHTKEG